jgi:methionyl-tRNA formyltransferase
LAWWAYILKEPIIKLPKVGVLNFHPSFLPYNRGKNYNFWTIVEDCPFGVTIHFVDIGIDTGDIIFQEQIYKTWEDNGKTLYVKAQQAIINLFIKNYNNIITGNYQRQQQNLTEGSFHTAKELDMASIIDLNKTYTAKELINLIRARTFEPHPSCWFDDNGEKFEIRVQISKVSQN